MDFTDVETLYVKNRQLLKEDVQMLLSWASKQAHLPQIPELMMVLFLHSCYYNIEATKKCVDTFYTVREHCPEFFTNRNLRSNRSELLETLWAIPWPKLTPSNAKVIFFKLVDLEPAKFSVAMVAKCFDMSAMLMLQQEELMEGQILLIDFKGVSMGHLFRVNLFHLKKFFVYFQEAMPVRIVGIHIINVPSYIDKFLAVVKPLMDKELYDLIVLHTQDLSELYKIIPPDCVVSDYGGSLLPIDELRENWHKNLLEHADYFVRDEGAVADESKRVGRPRNVEDLFGVDGSFKKLDID